jgi:hypothetical protein
LVIVGKERSHRLAVLSALLAVSLAIGCGGGGTEPLPGWPKRVTLSSPAVAQSGESVRLADGQIVADGGDVALFLAVQMSLVVGDLNESFCVKGTYETLAAVPTDTESCVNLLGQPYGWQGRLFLSSAAIHTQAQSTVIGLGALVLDRAREATYRLRILGDSYLPDDQGPLGTATFEYEPIPGR